MRKVLELLSFLDDKDIEWLVSRGQILNVPSGTTVIREGTQIDALYIILEGKLLVKNVTSAQRQIATLYSGEVVGEISFVDPRPPIASVIASENSRLLSLSADIVRDKLDRDLSFAARFYKALATFLAERLRNTTRHLGFGTWDEELEELDSEALDNISMAAVRFDQIVKRLTTNVKL